MQGVHISYANATIGAVMAANSYLLQTEIEAAKEILAEKTASEQYGKPDTLDLDGRTEISIREEVMRFDASAILISEEKSERIPASFLLNGGQCPVIFVADPTDRSSQMKTYLDDVAGTPGLIREVVGTDEAKRIWESKNGKPASVTGACTALTCVINGRPICSAIINYITQELFVACAAGVRCLKLHDPTDRSVVNLDRVMQEGANVKFPTLTDDSVPTMRNFVTFQGKKGYEADYEANFRDSNLMSDENKKLHSKFDLPGGPLRILYLSSLYSVPDKIGFILANGEKIGEWIHWLTFVSYATLEADRSEPALKLFDICQAKSNTKDGVLMAPSPAYSPFERVSETGGYIIDPLRLSCHKNPSKVRSTLIVSRRRNREVRRLMEMHGYRRIELAR